MSVETQTATPEIPTPDTGETLYTHADENGTLNYTVSRDSDQAFSQYDPDKMDEFLGPFRPFDSAGESSDHEQMQDAHNVLDRVQQLWDSTESHVKEVITQARYDRVAQAEREHAWEARIAPYREAVEATRAKIKAIEEQIEAAEEANRAKGLEPFTRKVAKIGDKLIPLHRTLDMNSAELERLEAQKHYEERSLQAPENSRKYTNAYKQLMNSHDHIEAAISDRNNKRRALASMHESNPLYAGLKQEVDSWEHDDLYRAKALRTAGEKFFMDEELEEEKESHERWERGFSDIEKRLEERRHEEEQLNDTAIPTETKSAIRSKLLKSGKHTFKDYRALLISEVFPDDTVSEVESYFGDWLKGRVEKEGEKKIEADVVRLDQVIDQYTKQVEVAHKIEAGEITEQKVIDAHKLELERATKMLEQIPEGAAFMSDPSIDKTTVTTTLLQTHIASPYKIRRQAEVTEEVSLRLKRLGY